MLKYRLGSKGYRHPAMINDASRALRLVRSQAAEWKLDPKRIGVMGSSAGGHLASTLLTHFDAGKADATDPVELLMKVQLGGGTAATGSQTGSGAGGVTMP